MMMIIISGHFRIFYAKDWKNYIEEKHYKQEILITKRTLRTIPHPSPLSLSYLATPMLFLNHSLSLLIWSIHFTKCKLSQFNCTYVEFIPEVWDGVRLKANSQSLWFISTTSLKIPILRPVLTNKSQSKFDYLSLN